jgi:hypothetical protein
MHTYIINASLSQSLIHDIQSSILNWSFKAIPSINTDVIINSETVVLGTNTAIKSIQLAPMPALLLHRQ